MNTGGVARWRLETVRILGASLLVSLLTGACAAKLREDRANIERLVSEFAAAEAINNRDRLSALFTPTATYKMGDSAPQPFAAALRELPPKRMPWDERTALTIQVQKIRFTGPDTASARAMESDFAPMLGISRQWLCDFVLVRKGAAWKIAAYTESAPEAQSKAPHR